MKIKNHAPLFFFECVLCISDDVRHDSKQSKHIFPKYMYLENHENFTSQTSSYLEL